MEPGTSNSSGEEDDKHGSKANSDSASGMRTRHFKRLITQCDLMLFHASRDGLKVPDAILSALAEASETKGLNDADIAKLNHAHSTLVRIVAPATPSTLGYLQEADTSKFRFLGPVATIRYMVVVSLASLLLFIWLGATDRVNAENLDTTLFYRDGTDAMFVSLFLVAAAAIGVSFSNLFMARQFVITNTYDRKYNTTYWMRFVLGLTSGYILAEVITLDFDATFQKPLLALVGGFAADVVYNILQRIVEGVQTMVSGGINARISSIAARHKVDLERQTVMQDLATAKKTMATRDELKRAGATDEQIASIDKVIKDLIGDPA